MAQASRRALTDISALKSFETGQPVSAALTAASNLDLSAPGTCATRSRWLLVMPKPSGSLSSVIVAVVSSLLAVKPAFPSCAESAMVKHPAWAAARSSSGLVPTPFSNLVLKEYCVCLSTPLSVEMVPFPSFKPPCQIADALRCMVSLLVRRLNRRGVVNEKVIRKWSSDPHRPRVMRSHSQGRRRSVDRGTCGPGIQPRKKLTPGRRRCKEKRKAPSGAPISRGAPESRAVRDPVHARRPLAREPGDPKSAQGCIGPGTRREV